MLLEISTTGCRVRLDAMPSAGSRLTLLLPSGLTGQRRTLRLRGRVVRTGAATAGECGLANEVAVHFESLASATYDAVDALVREYGRGPASWKEAPRSETPPSKGSVRRSRQITAAIAAAGGSMCVSP